MLTPLVVFIRAIGLYLLFTIPAIAVPFIYAYAACLAIGFGAVAGAIFIGFYWVLSRTTLLFKTKLNLLFLAVVLTITIAYCLIGLFDAAADLWGFNLFLVFPGIAVISGWASLYISRKAIRENLVPEEDELSFLLKP